VNSLQYLDAPRNPAWLHGTVYGTLLNYRTDLESLGARLDAPPYLAPPSAPILYLKPRNTWIGTGDTVPLPSHAPAVHVGATLGLVIGRTCVRIRESDAADCVAALTVVNDLCLPHAEVFRPAIKERCRDGFCPVGPRTVVAAGAAFATEWVMRTYIDGKLQGEWSTRDLVRPMARLLADVSEFMTLRPGDVLLAGTPRDMPLARSCNRVAVEVDGVGRVENSVVTVRLPA
jgi:5-oxopent-3-ene-1,2,5-tricarboxylate decarboxylase/2-hydroxyhepta-2,4-diene-1,7-dioate isomerase